MRRLEAESAKRTIENSPAIYRWDPRQVGHLSPRSGRLNGVAIEPAMTQPRLSLIGRPKLLSLIAASFLVIAASAIVFAQRKPSEATRPFVVLSSQSLDDLKQKVQPDNKTEELIDSAGMQLRVAVQHEKNRSGAAAELHDASDDVYYVLEGSAVLTLGGKLDAPKETDPGEWRSPKIIDGKTVEIKKGDLVIVPRGTPHQRSTANKDFTMILIKIYQEPLKKKA